MRNKIIFKNLFVFCLVLLGGDVLFSQYVVQNKAKLPLAQKRGFNLREAVEYALAHNPLLKASHEAIKSSHQEVMQARSAFYPRIDSSYQFTRWTDSPFAKFEVEGFPPTTFPVSDTVVNRWQLSIIQPIFTGFATRTRYKMSKLAEQATKIQHTTHQLDVIVGVKKLYYNLLMSKKLLNLAHGNVARIEAHKNDAEHFFKEGIVPRNDVMKAEVALAEARLKERQAAQRVFSVHLQLNRLMGINPEVTFAVSDLKSVENVPPLPDVEKLTTLALNTRPELKELKLRESQATEGGRLARSRFYPQISLFGTYYREGEDFFGTENDFSNTHNSAIGISMRWNLFEGGRNRSEVRQWIHKKSAIKHQYEDKTNQTIVQVHDAWEALLVSRANIDTARVAVKQAEENLRLTNIQYREQIVVFSEVLDAETYLLQAKTNYYKALYGFWINWAQLERAVGKELNPSSIQ